MLSDFSGIYKEKELLFEKNLSKGTSTLVSSLSQINTSFINLKNTFLEKREWNLLGTGQKQLIQLWYRLNPDNTYLCHCFHSSDLSNIEKSILLDIFDSQNRHPEWVSEAQSLHKLLKLKKDVAFFEKLDTLLINEDKLDYLSAETQAERVYIIRMVGKWFKQDMA